MAVACPAGQGKTRVGQELARRLAAGRWATLWLRGDAPAAALTVLADAAVPLLLVVDYAETRTAQVTLALRECARHAGDTPVRMLLLARNAGDWWDGLHAADPHAEALLDGTPAVRLPELEPELAGRAAAYQQAVTDLAQALAGLPTNRHLDWVLIADQLTQAIPDFDSGVSALTLQMTALANLLDAAEPAPAVPAPGDQTGAASATGPVDDRLLQHERRYWQTTAAACGLRPALAESTLSDALGVVIMGRRLARHHAAGRARPPLTRAP